MGMKPPLGDRAQAVGDCVNQPKDVDEFKNIPGTVSTLKRVQDKPIPGVVSQRESPKSSTTKGR
jgi:hypothetical protein